VIAIDTNLLVYAHRGAVPQHHAARQAIERAMRDRRGWGAATPSLAEFWMVVTHPSAAGRPSSGEEARAFIEALRHDGAMVIFEPQPRIGVRLLDLALRLGIQGPRVFDLQIGLCALEGGASELWTHDRGFVAPPGLRVLDPLARS
jgi:toxin-antitoxin system PIN domain toxin